MAKGKKTSAALASARGKHSRRKGKTFERDVARELRAVFGDGVKRGWQAREGSDAPDVEGVPGWWVEAKHHRRVNVRGAMTQVLDAQRAAAAKGDPRGNWKPLVIAKDDGREALAVLRFSDFLELLKSPPARVEVERRLVEALELEQPPKE